MGEVKPVMIRSMARACQVLQLLWQHEEIFKGLNAAYADDRGWERTGNEAKMWGIFLLQNSDTSQKLTHQRFLHAKLMSQRKALCFGIPPRKATFFCEAF